MIEVLRQHGHRIGCTPPDNCHECMDEARREEEENQMFIKTLRNVGGVKPCPECAGEGMNVERTGSMVTFATNSFPCVSCHGTGQILDPAPLLAKPKELGNVVSELCHEFRRAVCSWKDLHVIGTPRAHSLVYEVARQLGGTAAVAIENHDYSRANGLYISCYRLSLPIPPDATVLFVTDRVDDSGEMLNVMEEERSKAAVLPYVLCLIAKDDVTGLHNRDQVLKIITLHQDKSCPGN